jgi:hypothetical protein
MKAKELIGKVVVRTQPALFMKKIASDEVAKHYSKNITPEVLKIDERFLDEPVEILAVTEYNILIEASSEESHPLGFGYTRKVILPKYFLDGNWEDAEPFEKFHQHITSNNLNVDEETTKIMEEKSLEDNVNSAFADVVKGPKVDIEKIKDSVGLIFPGGEMEIDVKDKSDDEIVMEMISKLKGLKAERAKEVLDIIIDVAENMVTDMLEQNHASKELNNEEDE